MRTQSKKLFLGLLICIVANVSYAHVGYQNNYAPKAQVSNKNQAIQVIALKRTEAPFLMTTLGHRMHKVYNLVNRYSYVSLSGQYQNIYPEASARVSTVRPFIDYKGSRSY